MILLHAVAKWRCSKLFAIFRITLYSARSAKREEMSL